MGSLKVSSDQPLSGVVRWGLPDCLEDHDDHPVHRHDGGDGAEGADREDEDTNTVECPVRLPAVAGRGGGVGVGLPQHRHHQASHLSPWGGKSSKEISPPS